MNIIKSIDVEDVIRTALAPYMTVYCRPLPAQFSVPCILVAATGGRAIEKTINAFNVTLQARAEDDATASDYLRTALGVLQAIADEQTSAVRYITINTLATWGSDPVRPDLALCEASVSVMAHAESATITP